MKIPRSKTKKFSSTGKYKGLNGRVKSVGQLKRKLTSYKPFGPWTVVLCEEAEDDLAELSDKDYMRAEKIIEEIKTKPFQGTFSQHPLWNMYDRENEFVIWSAKINNEDRLNYLIYKHQNYILVTNAKGHMVMDYKYYPEK